ncbi:MAG TPA: deoxyribonuclease IV [Gemmataceae bacterium]|nr:deoxyribonuclease IV [Gemmataceae bacterium]
MPLFGAHMSIAGGYYRALEIAHKYDCEALQVFTKNSNQWNAKELTEADIGLFQDTLGRTRVRALLAHDSYLINLASPDKTLFRRSVEAFVVEVQRAERLGLHYLVTHPGAHVGGGEEAGLARVATALNEVHRRCPGYRVQVLLETTAGQGSCLGHRFEHLAAILEQVAEPERVGVCFDTCHVFAAGYSLAPEPAYRATMRQFDNIIGLDRLKAFHMNDSLKPLGSRVDRHAHIGRGCLGLEPFRLLINDRRFRRHPMLLETPKEDGRRDMDRINLRTLRRQVVVRQKVNRQMTSCEPQ